MKIRPIVSSDAEVLAALTSELGYPTDVTTITSRLTDILRQPDHQLLVAEADGQVVAWIHVLTMNVLESGFIAQIVGLVVAESQRRHGIGRKLVEEAEQWARDRGAGAIVVRSNTARAESHPFYLNLGYTLRKTQAAYRKLLT